MRNVCMQLLLVGFMECIAFTTRETERLEKPSFVKEVLREITQVLRKKILNQVVTNDDSTPVEGGELRWKRSAEAGSNEDLILLTLLFTFVVIVFNLFIGYTICQMHNTIYGKPEESSKSDGPRRSPERRKTYGDFEKEYRPSKYDTDFEDSSRSNVRATNEQQVDKDYRKILQKYDK